MSSNREKVIAGEVIMISDELRTLDEASLRRVYQDVGPKCWQQLSNLLATAKHETNNRA